MKNASQVGTQKVGDTAAPRWVRPASPYCQRAPYSALWGCHPLVCRTSTGLAQSRPDQFANWSARGRLRKQAPSLDGDRSGGVSSPKGNDTPGSLLYLYGRSSALYVILQGGEQYPVHAVWELCLFRLRLQSVCSFPGWRSVPAAHPARPIPHTNLRG